MQISKRKTKNGYYYSFTYTDKDGKKIRLSKDKHPVFVNEEDARAWARTQDAISQSRKDLIAKKIAWKTQYHDMAEMSELFAPWQRRKAPNSWERSLSDLNLYIIPWFLDKMKNSAINDWYILFTSFRDWLDREAATIGGKRIEKATANKIIHTLNAFLQCMKEYNKIDPDNARTCPAFPEHMLNTKDHTSVISPEEFKFIYGRLGEIEAGAAQLFKVLYDTGMRLNEAYGISLSSLFAGKLDNAVNDELAEKKIEYYGYLVLESQPASKNVIRKPDGTIPRKPLKGRKIIHPKNNRIVPIMDKDLWNLLARRFKAQKELYDSLAYGPDKANYILFGDLTPISAKRALDEAYRGTGFRRKTMHDCRHSFCTYFTGRTRSFFLAKLVLGHNSKAFDRYMHLFEKIALEAKQNSQEIMEI